MTKIHGQQIMDCDLLFDDQKITFHTNAKAALLNTIFSIVIIFTSSYSLWDNFRGLTHPYTIIILGLIALAFLLSILSFIKYGKSKKLNQVEFLTNEINKVVIQEKAQSLYISFHLHDNTIHKLSCSKDRYSGSLVNFLKESDVILIYI